MASDHCICGRVVTPFGIIEQGMVQVSNRRITAVGPRDERAAGEARELLDFPGKFIVPGFFDIHCHAGNSGFCYEDPAAFAEWHLRHGVTSILPTFIYNQSHDEIMETLGPVVEQVEDERSPITGIHMEGPYINPRYGAITSPIRPVNRQEYEQILQRAGHQIRLWTLAPELEGQNEFMETAARYGIVFSVGHSEASAEMILEAYRYGLHLGCHLTNASGTTPSPSRYEGTREVGVHEAVLLHDDMYAEVIPDRDGVHVRPLMLRLIVKTKGTDRVILITDATGSVDNEEKGRDGRDVRIIMSNENSPTAAGRELLSGSLLTLNRAVRNMMNHTGVGIVEACKMASLNPARLLGMDREIGSLEMGKRADILAVSEEIAPQMVMLNGEVRY